MSYLPEKSERKAGEDTLRVMGRNIADELGNLSHDSPDTLLEKGYSYHKRCRSVQDLKRVFITQAMPFGTRLEKGIHTTSDAVRYKT